MSDPKPHFFCPRPACSNHDLDTRRVVPWFKKAGFHPTAAFGSVQRYRCLDCGKYFSDQTFRLNYWLKKKTDFKDFSKAFGSSTSSCYSARNLKLSCDSFQNRVERLARNGLALHAQVMQRIPLDENLVADGLESYTQSKYFPNNIQILVGSNTGFLYDLNLCHFKRKGRMTEKQAKKAKSVYEDKSFKYKEMDSMFRRLLDTASTLLSRSKLKSCVLHTDENPSYLRTITRHEALSADSRFQHQQTSSRKARVRTNPLYPVNALDRLVRKDLPNHRRKTVCQAKDDRNMLLRMSWYQASHNYWKANPIKSKARQLEGRHCRSSWLRGCRFPGGLDGVFEHRFAFSHAKRYLSQTQKEIWLKKCSSPLHPKPGRIAAHVRL